MTVKAVGLINPVLQFTDASGVPYAGGSLTFYASGTTNLQDVYSDVGLSVLLTNPVSLNAAGRSSTSTIGSDTPVYLQALPYDIVLKDANGSTVYGPETVAGSDWPSAIQSNILINASANTNVYVNRLTTRINKPFSGTNALFAGTRFDALVVGAASATLTEAATIYIEGAPTSGNLVYAIDVAAGDVHLGGDVYTTDWTDYGATSTIVGWTSFTSKVIRYKVLGKLVFVAYDIGGTSNATSVTFTLPLTSANTSVTFGGCNDLAIDNGSTLTVASRRTLPSNSAIVTCYTDMGTTGWTNSGTKRVLGSFWYQSA